MPKSRQQDEAFRAGRLLDRKESYFRRRACAQLKGRTLQARVMKMSGRRVRVVLGDMQMRGESDEPADDAEHRERCDPFLDSVCEMHSGFDAQDL